MDFDEMSRAYRKAEDETLKAYSEGMRASKFVGNYSPAKPIIYDHIIVGTSNGEWLICRTNSASRMFAYEEIARCAVKHEAEHITHVLNEWEGQK